MISPMIGLNDGELLGSASTLTTDTDGTLAAASDARVATQKATKTYVDAAVLGLFDFKGSTDCSANPNYPVALKGDVYLVSVAGKVGGASGTSVDAGDMYVATADNAGGTEASVGTSWAHVEHNLIAATVAPLIDGSAAVGTGTRYAREDHVHPTDTTRAALASPTFTGTVTLPAITWGASGPQDVVDTVDPRQAGATLGNLAVGSILKRDSGSDLVVDEFIKYDVGNTNWVRTGRSMLKSSGAFANPYAACLRARTAADAQGIIRDIVGNQSAVASPTHVLYADSANTRMTDAIAAKHLVRSGTNVTYPANTSYADGTLVKDVHQAITDHYSATASATDYKGYAGTGAFAALLVVRFTAVGGGSYWISDYKQSGQAHGWHVGIDATGKLAIGANDATGHTPLSAATTGVYSDSVYRAIAFGRTVTSTKLWIASNLDDLSVADTSVNISSTDGTFGLLADLFGTRSSGATMDCPFLWWFDTATDAETIYANRVALTATAYGLLDL